MLCAGGKFANSRGVNNPPEHFVNNQVLTVKSAPTRKQRSPQRILPLSEIPILYRYPKNAEPSVGENQTDGSAYTYI